MAIPQMQVPIRCNETLISLLETRYTLSPTAIPLQVAYTSLIKDALIDNAIHLYKDKLRQNALHPIRLHAGQSGMPNGGIGRFAAPQLPEVIGGGLVGINI
jgi:hypothetical protein